MPLDAKLIAECTAEYSKSYDRLTKLVVFVVGQLEIELKRRKIMARVTGRAKNADSLRAKLVKWSADRKKSALFKNSRDVFSCVGDLAGVRVMTYTEQDRELVYLMVREIFASPEGKVNFDTDRKEESARIQKDNSNFYRATHMQVCLSPEQLVEPNDNLKGDHCEIQITSMLAHVWNEIEHDIRYKGDPRALSEDEILSLDSLGLLTKSGDHIISTLIKANARRVETNKQEEVLASGKIKTAKELSGALETHYGPTVWGKTINYRQNVDALWETIQVLKLTHPRDLFQVLSPSLLQVTVKQTLPQFAKYLKNTGHDRPKMIVESCDLFLIALFSTWHATIADLPKTNKGPAKRHIFFALAFRGFDEEVDE